MAISAAPIATPISDVTIHINMTSLSVRYRTNLETSAVTMFSSVWLA